MFVAGWRHALRSEWPFIIIIIIGWVAVNISDKWCACWCWELLLSIIIIITIIIVCIYLFGGPLWPYTYAPALEKNWFRSAKEM